MESSDGRPLRWSFLGQLGYAEATALQTRLRDDLRWGRGPEHLLLLEHRPVYTVGRNASQDDVLASPEWLRQRGVEVHETNRGGQVTYHGPGQLVGYPILNLSPDRRDIRRYVRDLQTVLVRTLKDFGIEAHGREPAEEIGVWVDGGKIASIGVHLSRWITIHGFALNVTTDLSFFQGIVACGLPQVRMVSVESLSGHRFSLPEVAEAAVGHFAHVFGRRPEATAAATLLAKERND